MIKKQHIAEFFAETKFFVIVLGVMMVFRTTAFGMYHIPSESMLPTLAVGDRITVNKFAYGYSRHSLPFSAAPAFPTENGRLFSKAPERGDIVVFKHPRTSEVYVKRVVGLPGDVVALRNGRIVINGAIIERENGEDIRYKEYKGRIVDVRAFSENLHQSGAAHLIYERSDKAQGDNLAPITIPAHHLFVLGDNRDNSVDSRYFERGVGFLPMENLVGRAEHLPFSFYRCRKEPGLACLERSWFSALR